MAFDNPWNSYYPGQTVTGQIIVLLDGPKKIRGIYVKVKGEANTCWSTDRQKLNQEGRYENESQTVTGHEDYFSSNFHVIGTPSGSEIELPAGEHRYPFSCSLPPNLPSSFEADYGHVRYTVKAIIDRPWKFDHEVKAAFTVIAPLDLNQEPRAAEPIKLDMTKTFCCLCCVSQPLNVHVSLPSRGYVPGQVMPIKINVENQSDIRVESVKLVLRKIVTFYARTPRSDEKREKLTVAEVSRGPVEPGTTLSYDENLTVPPLPPSNLSHCGIINLEYNLKIEARVSQWYHRNLTDNTLVFVGTVPLANYQSMVVNPPDSVNGYPVKPSAPPMDAVDVPLLPTSNVYPNLPPPSYEESTNAARSIRERGESDHVFGIQGHFAPRYPVYNFAPSQ